MTEDKNTNLMLIGLGIVTVFFAYLIYMKSKDTTSTPMSTPVSTPISIPIYQPIQQPTQQPTIDNIQLYQIQLQTQHINDTLRLQMDQIRLIQEQQLKQSESIIKLENVKCSNIVSMDNNNYNPVDSNNYTSLYNNYNPTNNNSINHIKNISTNVNRENEELIAYRMFGMK